MAFQTPIGVPLTETQSNLLAQLSSLKSFLSIPDKRVMNLDKSRQISSFDYLLRLTQSTIGESFVDVMFRNFISKLFDPNSTKLEELVVKSLAKSLDANGKKISNSETNFAWLQTNVQPGLHTTFLVAKAIIAKQIITMIFGPKEKMDTSPEKQTQFLNYATCAEGLFSVSNDTSDTDGDIEFNTVQLRQRLQAGQIIFTISCQDVKISLPANIDDVFNQVINPTNTSTPPVNPAVFFDVISTHVGNETQRINSPVNNNAISKSFLQIIIEKIMNLITPAMEPHLAGALTKINSGPNGNLGLTSVDILSDPCTIRNLCGAGNESEFKKKSAFTASISNLLFAMICSIMLQLLIKEIKKLIANALAKRAKNKLQRKLEKQKQRLEILDSVQDATSAIQKSNAALETLNDIFNFDKQA